MNSEPAEPALSGLPEVKVMADTSVLKAVSQTVANAKATNSSQAKVGPSKFDQVRANLEQPSSSSDQHIAHNTSQIASPAGKRLEAEFKKQLDQVRQRDLDEIFKADLQASKQRVDAIRRKLAAQPSTALEPVKERLLEIENQFLQSGRLIRGLGNLDSPQDYLRIQFEVYRLTQNVELVAKIAGEAATGVNKVLSTQV